MILGKDVEPLVDDDILLELDVEPLADDDILALLEDGPEVWSL